MDLRTYEGRLQTFENWPTDHPLKPESLARAGQYYTGEAEEKDETSCYLCRGRLRDWEAGDDPYEEHKSNYPECPLSKQPALQVCQVSNNLVEYKLPVYLEKIHPLATCVYIFLLENFLGKVYQDCKVYGLYIIELE